MTWVQDLEYVVEPEESRWTVSFQAVHHGEFGSRHEALESALRDAERVRRMGHRVRVLVRRGDGRLRTLPEGLHARQPAQAPIGGRPPGTPSRSGDAWPRPEHRTAPRNAGHGSGSPRA